MPVAGDLFETTPEGVYLIGGRSKTSGRFVFPLPTGISAEEFERVCLGRTGRLWSWTVQRFRPKTPPYAGPPEPEPFQPYAVGYVELPGEVIVESRLAVADFSVLRLGLEMETIAETFAHRPDGAAVLTYAFRPRETVQ
jgi:uncharacterized OB-fold protein